MPRKRVTRTLVEMVVGVIVLLAFFVPESMIHC
jgi:hypothetical protein